MNANDAAVQVPEFDPQQLILRAKRRRNFSERFDSFSDAYVWVLAALVALAYLFSAIFGLIFALLGQGVPHPHMPLAVWSLQELSPVLLVLATIYLFRLLLHLGPLAVDSSKAEWWLPLPLHSNALRGRALRQALLLGMLASAFIGIIWLIVLYGLAGAFDPLVAGWAMVCFVLAGIVLTNLAVVVQSNGKQDQVQRWLRRAVLVLIVVLVVFWGLLKAQNQWVLGAVESAADAILQISTWVGGTIILFCLGVLSSWWSHRTYSNIGARALRSSGENQQLLWGSLMQADYRAATAPSTALIGRRRSQGRRLVSHLPVAWRVLVLRIIRGARWHLPVRYLVLVMALTMTVEQIANPLSAVVFYLLLSVLLTLNVSAVISPLLTQSQLTQHLGQSAAKLRQTAALFAVLYSALALTLLTAGLGALGVIELSNAWMWGAAVLLGSLGSAAGSLGYARRKERDWESLLGGATNDVAIAAVLFNEVSTLVRAVATLAPLLSLVLSPQRVIAWPLWLVSLIFAFRALHMLVGEFSKQSRS
ncbi:hypothetical protein QMQ05_02080 [Glutamicibacter ectropisis]|uniref:ABC transporter permease n=1 Tax=Glutamicibacter ectropisis TaxID=3046593 RepID=A0AAU6WF23_9MICC